MATHGLRNASLRGWPMGSNKLRERFGWDDVTLDQAWAGLIEEAARRYVEGAG